MAENRAAFFQAHEDVPPVRFVKRRRQRYIRIRVKADEIVVSAPFGAGEREMIRFYQEKKEWAEAAFLRLNGKREQLEMKDRFTEGLILYRGEWVRLLIRYKEKKLCKPDFSFDGDTFMAQLFHVGDERRLISGLYSSWAVSSLKSRVKKLSESTGLVSWKKISVRNQKSRWGSCSAKGTISLNWRLIKCPDYVRDYIIVHELCHLVHMNHSRAFWALVDHKFPNRREAEAWLKANGQLVFLTP